MLGSERKAGLQMGRRGQREMGLPEYLLTDRLRYGRTACWRRMSGRRDPASKVVPQDFCIPVLAPVREQGLFYFPGRNDLCLEIQVNDGEFR